MNLMVRRDFLCMMASAGAGTLALSSSGDSEAPKRVMSVLGWINASSMGSTLSHEHVMCDFIGADQVSKDRYVADEVVKTVQPYLEQVQSLGCKTFIDCTPAYIGRDAEILRTLSENRGIHILTNTGYYGAAGDKYVPAHAYDEQPEQLAARWIAEWKQGIDGTGIRPGFMKIGVDSGPLSEIDRKLVRAACIAHLDTGLTIASHTGDGTAALEQLDELESLGVSPSAFIWVHAQNEHDLLYQKQAAERGAWLSFDGISPSSTPRHLEAVQELSDDGFFSQILVSHDAGWYSVGEDDGGSFRHYNDLYRRFLPAFFRSGRTKDDITQLMERNPVEAFAVRIRAV